MSKVFDEWKSGFTYDKADESPFAIFVGYDEYVDAIAADLQRHKDALDNIAEFAKCIPLHTEDEHAIHFVEMILKWAAPIEGDKNV